MDWIRTDYALPPLEQDVELSMPSKTVIARLSMECRYEDVELVWYVKQSDGNYGWQLEYRDNLWFWRHLPRTQEKNNAPD